MVLTWWEESGLSGLLAEEYPLVAKHGPVQRRRVDAVAVTSAGNGRSIIDWRDVPDLTGQDIVVVQAKVGPITAPLIGQAVGSLWLAQRHDPRSVRSVLLCSADEPLLTAVAEDHGVEVVALPQFGGRRFSLTANRDLLSRWARLNDGKMMVGVSLDQDPSSYRAHALHSTGNGPPGPDALAGRDITVLTAPHSFGMYAFGQALAGEALMRHEAARSIRSVVITDRVDPLIANLCRGFGIEVAELTG